MEVENYVNQIRGKKKGRILSWEEKTLPFSERERNGEDEDFTSPFNKILLHICHKIVIDRIRNFLYAKTVLSGIIRLVQSRHNPRKRTLVRVSEIQCLPCVR